MAAPSVSIGQLATRIRAPAPEAGFLAGRLADEAIGRLGPALDRALMAAGLADEAVIALPRLALRLELRGTVSAAELGEAWAQALARAILAARSAGREGETAFADAWGAEQAVLRALLAGEALPWWAASLGFRADAPLLPAILARWVARDAIMAARRMIALLERGVPNALLPDAVASAHLASALVAALREAMALFGDGLAPRYASEDAALAALLAGLPPWLRARLATIPQAQRVPWLVAAVLVHSPVNAAWLPALLPRLARLPAEALRAPETHEAAAPEQAVATEIWCGGLLLLIRPLARLHPEWLALGEALPPRLLTLGLIALRRLAAPLPPAARRATLERDRALLGLFAGVAPPDGPLEEAPLPDANAAQAALARLVAAMPEGVEHAPGALRRTYGGDPFGGDREGDALCRLLLRPGRLTIAEAEAVLAWPADHADVALRKAGWDLDPGWVPWLGRRIRFRYGAS